jgi:hypothetical protein
MPNSNNPAAYPVLSPSPAKLGHYLCARVSDALALRDDLLARFAIHCSRAGGCRCF